MDPNANLKEQIELARELVNSDNPDPYDAMRLAELVLSLDNWITRGGFLPANWER